MITVYVDVLFFINFIINILIVEGCALIICEDTKWYKTVLAAFLGAVYAVAVFFPDLEFFQSLAMKLVISGIMVGCAFRIGKFKRFLKIWSSFYLVSFIFGGGIIAVMSLTGLGQKTSAVYSNGSLYFYLPWQILIASSAGVYVLIMAFSRIRRKRIEKEKIGRRLTIYINGTKADMRAIIDTGNSLVDPISGVPVIVCEYEEIKKLLPAGEENKSLFEIMAEAGMKARLVPFSSVGEEKGLMPGFLPDMVKIDEYKTKRCVVCISLNKLSEGEEYHALLNPMLIVN